MVQALKFVMAGLCPGHPRIFPVKQDVDARHKAGHDVERSAQDDSYSISAALRMLAIIDDRNM
jgi:hypothetical protein